ncbi:MAG: hypothetical protein Q9214_006684 [Letrouitia sp. 1 TL-2023]
MRVPFWNNHPTSTTILPSDLNPADLEKNAVGQGSQPPISHVLHSQIPPKLLKFQTLIGIRSPTLLISDPAVLRPAANEGIYKRTVNEEAKVSFQYRVSTYAVNVGGMLQIVVGAALTALGAASGPSAAVTILGAVNTVIAGMLTYLKGQGLPNRLEQYLHLLRTLREHIEERERELLELDCPLDVDAEIERIARMYQEVRQTKEDNAPGTVLPPRGVITSLLKKPDIPRSDVMAPTGDKSPTAVLKAGLQDLATFGSHMERDGKAAGREQFEIAKVAAEEEKQSLGKEIQHLGSVAKDTFEKISSGAYGESQRRRSTDPGGS